MKNHLEVHQLNEAYMEWILLLEDRILELESAGMASQ